MHFVDFLGFVATMLMMGLLTLRRGRQSPPPDSKEKQELEVNLKRFLKELHVDEEDFEEEEEVPEPILPKISSKPIPIPPPYVPKKREKQSEPEKYETFIKTESSKGRRLMNQLSSSKDLVIYHEILKPPVSLR